MLPSPCSGVRSLPTTPPAAQLQHTPLKSFAADDGVESVIEQVCTDCPVVGMCQGAVWRLFGKEKEKGVFLICVGAFVPSFKPVFLIFFWKVWICCQEIWKSRFRLGVNARMKVSRLPPLHCFSFPLIPRWEYHSTISPILFLFILLLGERTTTSSSLPIPSFLSLVPSIPLPPALSIPV